MRHDTEPKFPILVTHSENARVSKSRFALRLETGLMLSARCQLGEQRSETMKRDNEARQCRTQMSYTVWMSSG